MAGGAVVGDGATVVVVAGSVGGTAVVALEGGEVSSGASPVSPSPAAAAAAGSVLVAGAGSVVAGDEDSEPLQAARVSITAAPRPTRTVGRVVIAPT